MVVMRMLANVQQVTIGPLIKSTIAPDTTIYTDEYDIYSRLATWGFHPVEKRGIGVSPMRFSCDSRAGRPSHWTFSTGCYAHLTVNHGRGEYARRGRRWLPRSSRQHHGRLLVALALLAATASGDLAREIAAVHRPVPVRAQREKARKMPTRITPDHTSRPTSPEHRMSHNENTQVADSDRSV